METHGILGMIHISSSTYDAIKDCRIFECTSRGGMNIKGKGFLNTYLVKRRELFLRPETSLTTKTKSFVATRRSSEQKKNIEELDLLEGDRRRHSWNGTVTDEEESEQNIDMPVCGELGARVSTISETRDLYRSNYKSLEHYRHCTPIENPRILSKSFEQELPKECISDQVAMNAYVSTDSKTKETDETIVRRIRWKDDGSEKEKPGDVRTSVATLNESIRVTCTRSDELTPGTAGIFRQQRRSSCSNVPAKTVPIVVDENTASEVKQGIRRRSTARDLFQKSRLSLLNGTESPKSLGSDRGSTFKTLHSAGVNQMISESAEAGGCRVAASLKQCIFWSSSDLARLSHPRLSPHKVVKQAVYILFLKCGIFNELMASFLYLWFGMPAIAIAFWMKVALEIFLLVGSLRFYQPDATLTLAILLIAPASAQIYLGGFIQSGAMVFWASVVAVIISLSKSPRAAKVSFAGYLFSVLVVVVNEIMFPVYLETGRILLFAATCIAVGMFAFLGAYQFACNFELEHVQSEALLQNIMPLSVIRRLKQGESHIIEHFGEVTILVADLVGFTRAASRMNPDFLIRRYLRDLFSTFDDLCERKQLEKIKTVGDAYVLVGGMHNLLPDHAQRVIELAFEFQDSLLALSKLHKTEFQMRVGIHTGPVIAGVLDRKKIAYGEFHNRAARGGIFFNW